MSSWVRYYRNNYNRKNPEIEEIFPSPIPLSIPSSIPITDNEKLLPVTDKISSTVPSTVLSTVPSTIHSTVPSTVPSTIPSKNPSTVPSTVPSTIPSTIPSKNPSTVPSTIHSTINNQLTTLEFVDKNTIQLIKTENANCINCIDFIDAILYINLEHRSDRKVHCLNEIKKIDPTLKKTHRIDAVRCKENGALGCSLSHIKALKLIIDNPDWKNIIILEDDFTFSVDNGKDIHNIIYYTINSNDLYDMILLGLGAESLILEHTNDMNIKRILSAQTTSGYIVNRKYVYTLLANYIQSSSNMVDFGWKTEWCLDQHWKRIMPLGIWLTFKNRIGSQFEDYSDIEGRIVKYNC